MPLPMSSVQTALPQSDSNNDDDDFAAENEDWKLLPDCYLLDDKPGCVNIGLIPTTTPKPG